MAESIVKMTGGVIRQQKNTILKDVNIDIQSGEFIYLIGKVGSGKSSFLKTLYAELPLEYGDAEVAGFQLKRIKKSQIPLLRRKCGIVFQDFKLLIDRNVYDNLEFVLRATGWKNKKAIKERIETVLLKVGMTDKQTKMPHQLSGGEQQRIVLARALLNAPPLILADEPTGNIDPETSYQLAELLKEICDTGKTIIIATHQYDLIERYPGRVFCCENGTLYEKTQRPDSCECTETEVRGIVAAEPEDAQLTENEPEATLPTEPEAEAKPETEPETEKQNENDPETQTEEIVTTITVSAEEEIQLPEPEKKEILPEITEPEEKIEIPEKQPVATEEQDARPLIGELVYPEITAFDYEINAPEKKPQTEEKKDTPPPFDLELID